MDPRVSFITLAVPDLDAARAFYVDGLGWEAALEVAGDVLMIKVGDKLVLSLWAEAGFEGEVGPIRRGDGHVPITLPTTCPRARRSTPPSTRPARPGRRTSANPRSASGAATPATSPTRRASAGRSPQPRPHRTGRAAVTTLTAAQIQHEGLADWVLVVRALEARYETNGFATGLDLVARIGAAAEEADHHPDVTLTWPTVLVRLWSHDSRGVTERDIALARRISEIAQDSASRRRRPGPRTWSFALDTADIKATGPFWAAVLGYDWDEEHLEIVDPDGRMPTTWFQQTDAHDEPRQRWHLDIHVDPAVADQRIDAALAAGGVLVSDEEAPSFTILADPRATGSASAPGSPPRTRSPDANIRDGDPACWDAGEIG